MKEDSERYEVAKFEAGGRGPGAKECRQPLETGKDKETDSPPRPPESNTAPWALFYPVRPILDF